MCVFPDQSGTHFRRNCRRKRPQFRYIGRNAAVCRAAAPKRPCPPGKRPDAPRATWGIPGAGCVAFSTNMEEPLGRRRPSRPAEAHRRRPQRPAPAARGCPRRARWCACRAAVRSRRGCRPRPLRRGRQGRNGPPFVPEAAQGFCRGRVPARRRRKPPAAPPPGGCPPPQGAARACRKARPRRGTPPEKAARRAAPPGEHAAQGAARSRRKVRPHRGPPPRPGVYPKGGSDPWDRLPRDRGPLP